MKGVIIPNQYLQTKMSSNNYVKKRFVFNMSEFGYVSEMHDLVGPISL